MPQYQVKRPFSHQGRVRQKWEVLSMTDREARYLVMGSDPWVAPVKETADKQRSAGGDARTATAEADTSAPKAPKGKKSEDPVTEGGEVNA